MPRSVTLPLLLVLAALAAIGCACRQPPDPAGPRTNVILITVDTLRADHLSTYGYPRQTSPHIDALAASGATFEYAIAPIPETFPSLMSLMTSAYPIDHCVRRNIHSLQQPVPTLAERMLDHGYRTAAYISSIVLREGRGMARGFERYDSRLPTPFLREPAGQRTADATTDAALSWLTATGPVQGGFFLWLHYNDPHSLYLPPSPFDQRFREGPYEGVIDHSPDQFFAITEGRLAIDDDDVRYMIDRYDGEIAFLDEQIGRLLAGVDELGLSERTLIVLTADHGESLGEHDYFFDHGDFLFDDQIRVPLIFRHPDVAAGQRIDTQVELVDIKPTILDLVGIDPREFLRGRSLWPRLTGAVAALESRPAYSESDFCEEPAPRSCDAPKIFSLREQGHKAVLAPGGFTELYDLVADPAEMTDRAVEDPQRAAAMAARIAEWLDSGSACDTQRVIDPALLEQMRRLGYVE